MPLGLCPCLETLGTRWVNHDVSPCALSMKAAAEVPSGHPSSLGWALCTHLPLGSPGCLHVFLAVLFPGWCMQTFSETQKASALSQAKLLPAENSMPGGELSPPCHEPIHMGADLDVTPMPQSTRVQAISLASCSSFKFFFLRELEKGGYRKRKFS